MTDTTERSGFVYMHKLLKQLMILLLCTVLIGTGFAPASVSAASRPVTISSCKISGKMKFYGFSCRWQIELKTKY